MCKNRHFALKLQDGDWYHAKEILFIKSKFLGQFSLNSASPLNDSIIIWSTIPAHIITSSSCRVASTDIPDPLSPLLPIVHRLWQVLRAASRILTDLLYEMFKLAVLLLLGHMSGSITCWPSCFCSGICGGTSLMSSSLLLQQCPAFLVRLTWIDFVMRGWRPDSWCFVGCCLQDLFNTLAPSCCIFSTDISELDKIYSLVHPSSPSNITKDSSMKITSEMLIFIYFLVQI